MTRIMRDSTTPADIPVDGTDLVAGYVSGSYAWPAEGADGYGRFPAIPHVHIDVLATHPHEAGVLDVETGDARPGSAPGWVKARREAFPRGYPPIIYCNRSFLTPVFDALNAAGLQVGRDFRLWIATLDGTTRVADMTGVTAVQYKRARQKHPDGSWAEEPGQAVTTGHFDESIVYDDDWHHRR